MKQLLTITIILSSIICFGQSKKVDVTAKNTKPEKVGAGFGFGDQLNDLLIFTKSIPLSEGEKFTMREHKEYVKQMAPYVKEFFKRDSVNRKLISNTVIPHLLPGDTVESYEVKDTEIIVKLKKPKKK